MCPAGYYKNFHFENSTASFSKAKKKSSIACWKKLNVVVVVRHDQVIKVATSVTLSTTKTVLFILY